MIKKIKEKINNKNGASLLVGLLIFFACAVVAGTLVTAASASSGRLSNYRQQENAYLIIRSTIDDITERIEDKKYTLTRRGDGSLGVKVTNLDNDMTVSDEYFTRKGIIPFVIKGLETVTGDGGRGGARNVYVTPLEITCSFTGEGQAQAEYAISGTMAMDAEYNITINLDAIKPSGYGDASYKLEGAYSSTLEFACAGIRADYADSGELEKIAIQYAGGRVTEGKESGE